MQKQVLIAGGGIGGMAAALASLHAGWNVQLYERATAFEEIGAGVQLGPNVVRRLNAWELGDALHATAAFPERVQVRSASTGRELASLPLGNRTIQKYGAAYATIHRADLHQLLLHNVRQWTNMEIHSGHTVQHHADDGRAVLLQIGQNNGKTHNVKGHALIGADGLRSLTRTRLLGEPKPTSATPHMAWRAVVPNHKHSNTVTLWLGPQLHVVHYPVRRGELLNIVAICHGTAFHNLHTDWNQTDRAQTLADRLIHTCTPLQEVIRTVPNWRTWPLLPHMPLRQASDMARGLVALLGDAAHPMFPYMAQGAGMAIEDAAHLQQCLGLKNLTIPLRLQHYAMGRWRRNAKVQQRALLNATIFHASGPLRLARDIAMQLLGKSVLDVPWLYRG